MIFFNLIKKMLAVKPKGLFAEVAKAIRGVSEETTTGVHRLYKLAEEGKLLFPGDQRERLGHEVEVRQPLWLP